jgi:hypothetical protein
VRGYLLIFRGQRSLFIQVKSRRRVHDKIKAKWTINNIGQVESLEAEVLYSWMHCSCYTRGSCRFRDTSHKRIKLPPPFFISDIVREQQLKADAGVDHYCSNDVLHAGTWGSAGQRRPQAQTTQPPKIMHHSRWELRTVTVCIYQTCVRLKSLFWQLLAS